MKLRAMRLCAITLILTACNGDDGIVGTGSGGTDTPLTISGAAQKGPFIIGSEVLMSQLQSNGAPTANTSLTEISDNLGNFKSYVTKSGPVLITADGYHFNEITGKLSQGRLLLKAIYNATSEPDQHAFINILTHLAYKRTLKLLGQGTAVADAIKQAESEVVNAFKPVLPVSGVTDFTELNIYDVDKRLSYGNAYALALSATIYQYAMLKQKQSIDTSIDAQLTDILNNLADDLASNGTITNTAVITALVLATRLLRPDQIRKNLEDRSFDVSGTKLPVANIDLFIDTDGDGMVNAEDPDDDNDGIPDELDPSPYVYSEAPVLIKPDVTNTLPSKQEILFEWTSSDYAKNFEIQISKNAEFATMVVSKLTPDKTFAVTLDAGVYYIRARAENVYGFLGVWSSPIQLQVGVFTKSYGGSGSDSGTKVIQTSDGGYAIIGTTTSSRVQNSAVLLLRLNTAGDILWKKTFDTAEFDFGSNIVQTPDGGFVLTAGISKSNNSGSLWLIKTDSAGIQDWSTITEGINGWRSVQIFQEADGILIGSAWNSTYPQMRPTLLKIDLKGDTLWTYTFNEDVVNFQSLIYIDRNKNGDYLLIGNHLPTDKIYPYQERPFFAQLSADRTLLSSYIFTTDEVVGPMVGATFAADSNLLLLIQSEWLSTPLYKFDASNKQIWSYPTTKYPSFSCDFSVSPVKMSNGAITYAVNGWINDTQSIVLTMLDKDGYLIRTQQYGSFINSYACNDIVTTSDGGLAVLGITSYGSGEILLINPTRREIP